MPFHRTHELLANRPKNRPRPDTGERTLTTQQRIAELRADRAVHQVMPRTQRFLASGVACSQGQQDGSTTVGWQLRSP